MQDHAATPQAAEGMPFKIVPMKNSECDCAVEESTSADFGEIFLISQSEVRKVNEEKLFQAFLRNAPPGLAEEFRSLYREFHGGP